MLSGCEAHTGWLMLPACSCALEAQQVWARAARRTPLLLPWGLARPPACSI